MSNSKNKESVWSWVQHEHLRLLGGFGMQPCTEHYTYSVCSWSSVFITQCGVQSMFYHWIVEMNNNPKISIFERRTIRSGDKCICCSSNTTYAMGHQFVPNSLAMPVFFFARHYIHSFYFFLRWLIRQQAFSTFLLVLFISNLNLGFFFRNEE